MKVFLALVALLACAPPLAQPFPRTPDGKPDFQGLWYAAWLTRLQRNTKINRLVIAPDAA